MGRRSPEQVAALIGTLVDHSIVEGSEWMAVGEGPGVDEADRGEPFVGMTGQEMRRFFNGEELPSFEEVSRANLYRIFGGKDYEFTEEDLARDEPILLDAIKRAQPKIIVAIGRHAARYFLGDVSMDEVHGLPWKVRICYDCGRVSLPNTQETGRVLGVDGQERGRVWAGSRVVEREEPKRASSLIRDTQRSSSSRRVSAGSHLQSQVVLESGSSRGSNKTRQHAASLSRAANDMSQWASVGRSVSSQTNTSAREDQRSRVSRVQEDSEATLLGQTQNTPQRCSSCESSRFYDAVVFCCYHPAAGFRSPELSALVGYDFAQLALFADGTLKPRKLYDDPIPNPQYFHVSSDAPIKTFEALGVKELCEDSEGYTRAPWSLQFAARPGTGYMIRATNPELVGAYLEYLARNRVSATFHSALHDRAIRRVFARLAGWSEERILFDLDTLPFDDTMVMAYLLQLEPQGLKGLATRHANMAMQSFDEVMGDAQHRKAMGYLQSMWDCCNFDYETTQQEAMDETNSTPLVNKDGSVKRLAKTGEIRYRKITKRPSLPKSDLFKATERCMRAKHPDKLWHDQRADINDAGYRVLGVMPEATLSDVAFPTALRYGCRDADATVRVKPEMVSRVKALGLESVYHLEIGTYPLIDRMMTVGMRPDLKVFSKLSAVLACEIADIQMRIEEATGVEGFNANSGDQVAEHLFHDLDLPVLKMTKGDEPRESTNDKILEALEKEHGHAYPIISDIRDYRETYKLKNTFVDRVADFVHRYPHDGRVHATFRTTRVITGRLAASDPNILAQPEHGKFAKAFKAGWVAEHGHVVCNWDLSQVELRVLAHLSRDPVLMEAYLFECPHKKEWQNGKAFCKRDACILKGDLHARLAHMVFGLMPSLQDDSQHRLPSKTHNFGLAMGMTCYGLMIELRKNGVEVDEDGAQEWIDASNKLYRKVPHYKEEKIAEARRNGMVRCLSGRVRYIGGIRSRDERLRAEAERFSFSTPIQEGAQMLMKQAEAFIWNELLMKKYYRDGYYKGGSKGRWVEPLAQVHDALKFEVAEGLQDQLNIEMCHAMTKVPTKLRVPLGVEGKWGVNFAAMEKFRRAA